MIHEVVNKMGILKNLLKYYLIVCGLALHVGAGVAVYFALAHFALTPTQFLIKGIEKSGLDAPFLVSLFDASISDISDFEYHERADGKQQHKPSLVRHLFLLRGRRRRATNNGVRLLCHQERAEGAHR